MARRIAAGVPAAGRRADLVWQVEQPADGIVEVLHVELQTKVERDIGERMADYALRLYRQHHQAVRSLVLYLRMSSAIPAPVFLLSRQGVEYLRFTYEIVRLWEISAERVLALEHVELWLLCALMADVRAESLLDVADRIASAPIAHSERAELTGLLCSLAGVRFPRQTLCELTGRKRMIEDLLRDSSVAEEFRQEGRQEGQQEGLRHSILAVVEAHFGLPAEDLRAAISQANEPVLRALLPVVAAEPLARIRAQLVLPA
jgi:hypothetical protein